MNNYRIIQDAEVANKRVLLRVDLNVPMKDGKVTDNSRIVKLLPTIFYLLERQAKIVIISHFGRPDGKSKASLSLEHIAQELSSLLKDVKVKFCPDVIGTRAETAAYALENGEILLMENLRFEEGEEKNDLLFALKLAGLAELYVNDTLSCSHRAHASISAITKFLPSCAGLLLQDELTQLKAKLTNPAKPMAAIIGGAKISTKLELLNALMKQVDYMIIGGAMANTFLKAKGISIGKSLCEEELLEMAREIIVNASNENCAIILPQDAYVARELCVGVDYLIKDVQKIENDEMILDIGPQTAQVIKDKLKQCKTVVWNGPLGAFEVPPFDSGTSSVAEEVAALTELGKIVSVAGGGDVVAALGAAKLIEKFSYISTAGGAFLEWLEGKELPGVEALKDYVK